jgi:NitT/TauT family transport system permease protein/sulfonate transport system permease protein
MKSNSQTEKNLAARNSNTPLNLSFKVKQLLKKYHFLSLLSITAVLAFWHYISINKILGGAFLPTPWAVVQEIYRLTGEPLIGKNIFQHTWASLRRVLIGWSIGCAVAIPLGVWMALNEYVRAVVKPVFDLFKPMPPISWISLSILWFGLGEESKVFIIIIGSFVPSLINSFNSLRLVDPALYDAARMLGANRRQEIMEVAFFGILPGIFAGLQISLSLAWSCVLAAELVGGRSGIGFIIILGMNQYKPAMIIAGMVVIALTAWFLTFAMERIEKLVCPWRRDIRV